MKFVNGWWIPDNDNYMQYYNGDSPIYTQDWLTEALTHSVAPLPSPNWAVVCGPGVGYVLEPLISMYAHIAAYEPIPTLKEAMDANIANRGWVNVVTYPMFVVDFSFKDGAVSWDSQDVNLGRTEELFIQSTETGDEDGVEAVSIDSLGLKVDFLYIDTHGAESSTLASANGTINSDSPLIYLKHYGMRAPERYTTPQYSDSIQYLKFKNYVEQFTDREGRVRFSEQHRVFAR